MKYEPKKIAALLVALGLLAAGCQAANQTPGYTTPLKVGGAKIFVKVAKSDEEKRHGLSGQERLKDEQGMLFDFTQEPLELHNAVNDEKYRKQLTEMRNEMIRHLSERGEEFVKDGRMVVKEKSMLYAPHYPEKENKR